MPKVLVLGATGYLGRRVVEYLIRSGQHRVYGIARSEDKARSLALSEAIPIVCADLINDSTVYLNSIRKSHIDVVIDVTGANQDSAKILSDIKRIGKERLDSYAACGIQRGPKLGFIYCSGTWVHGSSWRQINDLDRVGPGATSSPAALVSWRVDVENSILAASDILDVAVIRPALIYGHESTIWTPFILPLLQASRTNSTDRVLIPLNADAKPSLIHVDDAARGFRCVVEKLSLINGGSVYPVFDLVTSQESFSEIFEALSSTWEVYGGYSLIGSGDNLFAEAMSTTVSGSSARAQQLLGWKPKRVSGLVKNIDRFADAFKSQY